MQFRTIAPGVKRKLGLVLPVAAAALALPSIASAATVAPVIYTAGDTNALQSDISTADSASPGTLSIIELTGQTYQPTTSIPLSGNIEITGPPTDQAGNGTDPQINGGIVFTLTPAVPLFVVNSGANILFKAVDISNGGNGAGIGAIQDQGGNVVIDSATVTGSNGSALVVQSGTATVVNSSIVSGTFDGIEQNGGASGSVNLVNDTVGFNNLGAIAGPNIGAYNTLFVKNKQGGGSGACGEVGTSGDTFAGDYADDSSCGTTGVTVATTLGRYTNTPAFNGGPTFTVKLTTGNPAIGHGLAQYCPAGADQRFFVYSGTCDVGSYQHAGVQDTSTTGPTCTVGPVNESTNPAVPSTMTVNVTEPGGIGIGPDAVNDTITSNGTIVGTPVFDNWLNATDASFTLDPAYEATTAALPVTATKPVGDTTAGDTKWSFYATDWLGNTTYCK
jgi:hypothetical protein